MKITPIKLAAIAITIASLSLASCKSSGYGCDYGHTELNESKSEVIEVCIVDQPEKEIINTNYRKTSKP